MINLCLDKTYCPRRSMMEMFFCDHPDSDCLLFAYIMSQNQQLGIFNMYMMNHPCLPTSTACSTIAAVRKIQPKTYICCTNATKHSKSKHANDVRLASPAIKETCIFSSFAHFPICTAPGFKQDHCNGSIEQTSERSFVSVELQENHVSSTAIRDSTNTNTRRL